MIGFVLALVGEATTGRNVFQQVTHAPLAVASIFVLFTVATVVPVVRGVPRKGNSVFSSDAELINGRCGSLACCLNAMYLAFWQCTIHIMKGLPGIGLLCQ